MTPRWSVKWVSVGEAKRTSACWEGPPFRQSLFVLAGVSGRAAESKGLGGALTWLVKQPFGPWLLGAVALGIGCYGIYSFFRARHTKV